jgi:hypothetical protein
MCRSAVNIRDSPFSTQGNVTPDLHKASLILGLKMREVELHILVVEQKINNFSLKIHGGKITW